MKRLSILLIVLIVASLVMVSSISCAKEAPAPAPTTAPAPAPVKPVILRWSSPFPPMSAFVVKPQAMADRFNQRTGGKYQIEVFAAEELTKVMEHLEAVRAGSVEIACGPIGPMEGADIRFSASEFPYLYNNAEACGAATLSLLPMYNDITENKFNQKSIGCWGCGALELLSKKPVKTLEDVHNLLMQSVSPLVAEVITNLGASSVPIPFTESYQGLEKGVVDGGFWVLEFALEAKLHEVTKYLMVSFPMASMHLATMNLNVWNSLPKDVQDILADEMQKLTQELNDYTIKAETENANNMAGFGMEVYHQPKAERDRWSTAIEPLRQKLLAGMSEGDFGQKMMQIAEKANSEHPYSY